MRVELLRTLARQRALDDLPRDTARFRATWNGRGAHHALRPHFGARNDWPETFAAMLGDGAAAKWGHQPLGLPGTRRLFRRIG